jgi:hypothetical protein
MISRAHRMMLAIVRLTNAHERHIRAYQDELEPVCQHESDLVQSIADTAWRLARILGLEMAMYAKSRIQFAESFNDHELSLRPGMIELQTFLTYEKQLRNLQLYARRVSTSPVASS